MWCAMSVKPGVTPILVRTLGETCGALLLSNLALAW